MQRYGTGTTYAGKTRNKYNAKKVEIDGMKFDSQREGARYLALKAMQERGEISDLQRQVPFVLIQKFVYQGEKIRECKYLADFTYTLPDGTHIVEDVKGGLATQTPEFKIKRKLLLSIYGRNITFRIF